MYVKTSSDEDVIGNATEEITFFLSFDPCLFFLILCLFLSLILCSLYFSIVPVPPPHSWSWLVSQHTHYRISHHHRHCYLISVRPASSHLISGRCHVYPATFWSFCPFCKTFLSSISPLPFLSFVAFSSKYFIFYFFSLFFVTSFLISLTIPVSCNVISSKSFPSLFPFCNRIL